MHPFFLTQIQNPHCITLQKLKEVSPTAIRHEIMEDNLMLLNRSGKSERESLGEIPNSRNSDNFIVKWGDDPSINTDRVDDLLSFLEDSWFKYIIDMGHTPPPSSYTYYMNVYIGDTGGDIPSSYGAGGYYTTDGEGYPMMVIAKDILNDYEYLQITASHEFYHAIQGVTNRYNYDNSDPGSWFWESTATWASGAVYPDNYYVATFLPSYVLLSHLPVNYFLYPYNWILEEYYQYGSFLFPQHLTEYVVEEDLIRSAWEDVGEEANPFLVMKSILEEQGVNIYEVWMEHNAYMTHMDYEQHENYEYFVDYYDDLPEYSEYSRIAHQVYQTDNWEEVPPEIRLQHLGFHRISLDVFPSSSSNDVDFNIDFNFEATGSQSSLPHFMVTLVENNYGAISYHKIIEDSQISDQTEAVQVKMNSQLDLIVGVWSETGQAFSQETFPYQFKVNYTSIENGDDTANPSDSTTDDGNPYTPISPPEKNAGCQIVVGDTKPSKFHLIIVLFFVGVCVNRRS